jgi:hypothetical protein
VGLTFDTGALIGLERRRHAIRKVFATVIEHDVPIIVPTVAIAEWWRRGAHEKERPAILHAFAWKRSARISRGWPGSPSASSPARARSTPS